MELPDDLKPVKRPKHSEIPNSEPAKQPKHSETPNSGQRDWMELPDELTAGILSRLGVIDTLCVTEKVCIKWNKICKDPHFWRKIDMCEADDEWCRYYFYFSLFRRAVDRSSGNVVDINMGHFGSDQILCFMAKSCASRIRRLRLYFCKWLSNHGLRGLALKMPLLEELDITLLYHTISRETVKVIGRSCPLLRSFKFNKEWGTFSDDKPDLGLVEPDFSFYDTDFDQIASSEHDPVSKDDDNADAIAIAATMQGLRHLQLYGNKLTDYGLRKILDSCPHLESLDLRLCLNVNMGMDLETRCAQRIKRLWLPRDSVQGKGFTARSDGYCLKWVELPDNVTMSILSRLGTIDILKSAPMVCKKWYTVCKEVKWNSIDMCNAGGHDIPSYLDKICRRVADRSFGNLVDVNVEDFISDELLNYLSDSSSGIRRLRLVCSDKISEEGLIQVASKLALLQDVDITIWGNWTNKFLKVLGRSCLLLKSLKWHKKWHRHKITFDVEGPWSKDDDALAIAGTMHGLQHLQLIGNQVTDDGVWAIVDGCPHLKSLDIRYCWNLHLLRGLKRRCIVNPAETLVN